jgi:hypothetical protein
MKYDVLVTASATVSTWVTVEAADTEDAEDIALAEVQADPGAWEWVLDDYVPDRNEVYIADPGNEAISYEEICKYED